MTEAAALTPNMAQVEVASDGRSLSAPGAGLSANADAAPKTDTETTRKLEDGAEKVESVEAAATQEAKVAGEKEAPAEGSAEASAKGATASDGSGSGDRERAAVAEPPPPRASESGAGGQAERSTVSSPPPRAPETPPLPLTLPSMPEELPSESPFGGGLSAGMNSLSSYLFGVNIYDLPSVPYAFVSWVLGNKQTPASSEQYAYADPEYVPPGKTFEVDSVSGGVQYGNSFSNGGARGGSASSSAATVAVGANSGGGGTRRNRGGREDKMPTSKQTGRIPDGFMTSSQAKPTPHQLYPDCLANPLARHFSLGRKQINQIRNAKALMAEALRNIR